MRDQVFNYALLGEVASLDPVGALDPVVAASERANHVMWLISDALYDIDQLGQLQPNSYLVNGNPLPVNNTLTIPLKSVPFHILADDPREGYVAPRFDANVLCNILQRFKDPAPTHYKKKLFKDLIKHFRRGANDMELVLELHHSGIHYLSQIELIEVSPQGIPRGTGPYQFGMWITPKKLKLLYNTGYTTSAGNISEVVFTFYDTLDQISNAFASDQADFTPAWERLQPPQGAVEIEVPHALNLFYLGFDTTRGDFRYKFVRRAFVQAINVDSIVQIARNHFPPPPPGQNLDYYVKSSVGPLPDLLRAPNDPVQLKCDPDVAAQLLQRLNFDFNQQVTLLYFPDNSGPGAPSGLDHEVAVSVKQQLEAIGIRNVSPVPKESWRALLEEIQNPTPPAALQMFLYGWHVRFPHADRFLNPLFHTNVNTNLTRYSNRDVDKYLSEAQKSSAQNQPGFYTVIQREIVDDPPMVFLYHTRRIALRSQRVQNLVLNPGALPIGKLADVTV